MHYVEVFERMDKNKDGNISLDEFSEGIRVFSPSMTSEQMDELFKELDIDGDGQIGILEFAQCFVVGRDGGKDSNEEADMKKAFDLYDIDGDGKISASETHVVLKHLGEKHSMEECVEMVRAVDTDKDGFVSFEEFKAMMSRP